MKKVCNLKQFALKEHYLSIHMIKSYVKRLLRFLQLYCKAQLMICKIDALRGSGSDNHC